MKKNNFILYGDYKAHFALLSAEDQGHLLMAIFDYAEEGTEPNLSPAAMMAFSFIRRQLDKDAAHYTEVCEKRQEAGKKGGRPKKQKASAKANGLSEKQTKAKKPDTDTETETDTDTETDTEKKIVPPESPRGGQDALAQVRRRLEQHCFSSAMEEKILEWLEYKAERKEKYKEQGLRALLRQLETNVARYGDKAVCELIDESMASGWKGILFDRLKEPSKTSSKSSGRNVDPMDYITGPAFGWGD